MSESINYNMAKLLSLSCLLSPHSLSPLPLSSLSPLSSLHLHNLFMNVSNKRYILPSRAPASSKGKERLEEMKELQAMAQGGDEKWETFQEDEDEALSLSDLPVAAGAARADADKCKTKPKEPEDDFEFRTSSATGDLILNVMEAADMCSADEVFFQGQILPLRPSFSSSGRGLLGGASAKCGSRSESMDRQSTAVLSSGFCTSRSSSTSSSSSGSGSSSSYVPISRPSHLSRNPSNVGFDPPRLSLSNNFYSHPSPTPQLRIVRKAAAASVGRKSTGSAPPGWAGLIRLGVVKAPEIELHDLRSRRSNNNGSCSGRKSIGVEAPPPATRRPSRGSNAANNITKSGATRIHDESATEDKAEKKAAPVPRMVSRGFGCSCSPDAVEPILTRRITMKKKEEGVGSRKHESMCKSRLFQWLEELSIAKATGSS